MTIFIKNENTQNYKINFVSGNLSIDMFVHVLKDMCSRLFIEVLLVKTNQKQST